MKALMQQGDAQHRKTTRADEGLDLIPQDLYRICMYRRAYRDEEHTVARFDDTHGHTHTHTPCDDLDSEKEVGRQLIGWQWYEVK